MTKNQDLLDFNAKGPAPTLDEIFAGLTPDRKELRDYQETTRQAFLAWYTQKQQPEALIALATGLGKTLTASACVHSVISKYKGSKVLWVTHRDELVRQSCSSLEGYLGISVSVEKAERKAYGSNIAVASIQSLKGTRLTRFAKRFEPDLIIFDEAHHSLARGWMAVKMLFPKAKILNLTATPFRTDIGKRLELGKVLIEINTSQGIDMGFLVTPKPIGTLQLNLSGVGTRLGDYKQDTLEAVLLQTAVVDSCSRLLLTHGKGRRSIIFAASVTHGKALAAKCRQLGLSHVYEVYGDTPLDVRAQYYKAVRKYPSSLLINNLCLTEGFDLPELDLVANFRPTKSAALYIQMIGRGLRTAPGKTECLVIDAIDTAKKAEGKSTIPLPTDDDVRQASNFHGAPVSPLQVLLGWFYDQNEVSRHIEDPEFKCTRQMKHAGDIFKALFPSQTGWMPVQVSNMEKLQVALHRAATVEESFQALATLTGSRHVEAFIHVLMQQGWCYCPRNKIPSHESQVEEIAEAIEEANEEQDTFSVELLTNLDPKLKHFMLNVIGESTDLGKQAEAYYSTFTLAGKETVWYKPLRSPVQYHYLVTKDKALKRTYFWVRQPSGRIFCFSYRSLEGLRMQPYESDLCLYNKLPSFMRSTKWADVPMTEPQQVHVLKILKIKPRDLKNLKISKLSASALMSHHFYSEQLKRIPLLLAHYAKT
jgi:superfamily II DNA or RNA helicase